MLWPYPGASRAKRKDQHVKKLSKEQRQLVSRARAAGKQRLAKARIQETVSQKVGLVAGAAGLGYLKDEYDVVPGDTTFHVSPCTPMAILGYGASMLLPAGNAAAALEGVGDAAVAVAVSRMARRRGTPANANAAATPTADAAEGLDARETRAFEAGVDAAVQLLARQEREAARA